MSGTKEGVLEGVASPYSDGQIKRREVRPWWYPRLGGKDISFISVNEGYESLSSSKEDLVQNVHNVWTAPEAQEVYKPVEGYEGSHRFDPNAEWTPQEEKKLRRMVSRSRALKLCTNFQPSSTGELHYQLASCSSHYNSTVVTSRKLLPITCWTTLT